MAERRRLLTRIAVMLWIVWAIAVWNVVFDYVIVVAGREYVAAAVTASRAAGPYPRMDDWMRPAVRRGFWIATAAAAVILVVGLTAIRAAAGRHPGSQIDADGRESGRPVKL